MHWTKFHSERGQVTRLDDSCLQTVNFYHMIQSKGANYSNQGKIGRVPVSCEAMKGRDQNKKVGHAHGL